MFRAALPRCSTTSSWKRTGVGHFQRCSLIHWELRQRLPLRWPLSCAVPRPATLGTGTSASLLREYYANLDWFLLSFQMLSSLIDRFTFSIAKLSRTRRPKAFYIMLRPHLHCTIVFFVSETHNAHRTTWHIPSDVLGLFISSHHSYWVILM